MKKHFHRYSLASGLMVASLWGCDEAAQALDGLSASACETRSDCAEGERCIEGACVRAAVRDASPDAIESWLDSVVLLVKRRVTGQIAGMAASLAADPWTRRP